MKKILISLILALTVNCANATSMRPTYHSIDYSRGYNNGYQYGYHNGKSDEREKWEKAIVATALISFGAIIIYNVVTNSHEKPKDITHYNYRF